LVQRRHIETVGRCIALRTLGDEPAVLKQVQMMHQT
jgi:hypothetical protein